MNVEEIKTPHDVLNFMNEKIEDDWIDNENNQNADRLKIDLIKPAQIIKQGGIVVFPTETVYGIGTNGLDEKAIEKLYKIKQRPINKPIILLVSDIKMIENLAKDITSIEYKIMKEFFPGPLTIILKKEKIVPNNLTANTDTIGIRIPDNEIARKLIEYSNVPIATTSANISDKPSGIEIKNIRKDFGDKVDMYIDGGKSKLGIGSTIIKVKDGEPHILRHGSITKEQIIRAIK